MSPARRDPASRRAFLLAAGAAVLAACTARRTPTRPAAVRTSPTPGPSPSAAPTAAASAAAAGPTRVVRSGPTTRPEVALTFHGSGDPALAVSLLDEAERAGARITVFAVGTWLDQHPDMAARILHGGHALGNHTYTHPTLHRLSAPAIQDEVSRCAAVIRRLTGTVGSGFRPSGGPSITPPMVAAATRAGYSVVVGYDLDSLDNTDPGAAAVTRNVLDAVHAGSIVSLHLGHPGTVRALPDILSGLASRHLHPVTVPQLLAAG